MLVAAAVAAIVLVAGTVALAGRGASTRSHTQPKPSTTPRYAVDDTLPQGPSDPAGLVGVPVRTHLGANR